MEQAPETVPETEEAHQVFINHRGPDVKRTLASLIYHRLRSCGLSVFFDKKEVPTGDIVSDAILGAIQNASVHIAIFSERYAESSWCLDELYWILRSYHKRNTKIIPVFADVEPADLRHIENGRYAKAFEEHLQKGRVTVEAIRKWKTALNQASQISGLRFKTNECDHGEFLEEIVRIVLKEIFKWDTLEVAKYPVGLEQAAEDFQNEILEQSQPNSTTIVGIAGMGGLGKSTLAKYLYNLRRADFNGRSCFLSLSEARRRDLPSLQEKLLRGLLGNRSFQPIDNICKGKRILRDLLRRLPRIFIVLDDVDNMEQIESLLDVNAVACGSLILITSRDKDLLIRSSSKTVIYDVKPLHIKHARELFCLHAFSQSKPTEEFEDLVKEFLIFCGGLPLSLKVLGGLLVGRCDKEYWKGQLEKLSTTLPYDIMNPLKVSYEALDPEEKDAFLDIGCFLVGEEKELAIRVLEGLYDNRVADHLESLRQKCLVDFHCGMSDNKIECRKRENPMTDCSDSCLLIAMHDQLRELARHIAREELRMFPTPKSLRITCSNDMQEMLRSQSGLRIGSSFQVRGIRSSKPCSNDIQVMLPSQVRSTTGSILQIRKIGSSKDENPANLNDIRVEGVRLFVVEGLLFGSWNMRGELVWLRLRNLSYFQFPRSISLRRLRVLEIEGPGSSLEQLFANYSDLPRHLNDLKVVCTRGSTVLDIDSKVFYRRGSTSKSFPALSAHILPKAKETESSRQRRYIVPGVRHYASSFLHYLKSRVTGMRTLTRLVLKNLEPLESLPIDFSQLKNLRHLDLSGCYNLSELPKTFSHLMQLQYLSLQNCMNLSIPLDILGEISTLEYVNFKGCDNLIGLPKGIPYQKHLRYLNLLRTRLLKLPRNLEMLDKLEQLIIGSHKLKKLPLSMANLRGLEELFLINCSGLEHILPEGIAADNIKILAIDGCPIGNFSFQDKGNVDVENFGTRFLTDFTLRNTSITEICIPEKAYPSLETIDLSTNIRLMQVHSLPSALVSLNLENCIELKTLTNLSNLVNLKFLFINRCLGLETLNVEGLIFLEDIEAEKCWKLKSIEGLSELERLNCLNISTNTRVIWNVICNFLTSPSRESLAMVIFNGKADNQMLLAEGEIRYIMEVFNLQIKLVDIVSPAATRGVVKIENFHSYGAILICFITNACHRWSLRVKFYPESYEYQSPTQYTIHGEKESGRSLHILMWTEDSILYKDYERYTHIYLDCIDICAIESVERGWLVMIDKKTNALKVCKEFITAFA